MRFLPLLLLAGCSGSTSSIEDEIARHKFWAKPLTPAQAAAVLDSLDGRKAGAVVLVEDDGSTRALTPNEVLAVGNLDPADPLSRAVTAPILGPKSSRFFVFSFKRYRTQPDRRTLAEDLKRRLDEEAFRQ